MIPKKLIGKVVNWAVWVVILSLIPIFVNVIWDLKQDLPAYENLGLRGDLLLIAVAVCAASFPELIQSENKYKVFRNALTGLMVGLILFSTLYLGMLLHLPVPSGIKTAAYATAQGSLGITVFLMALVLSGCSVVTGNLK